MSIFACNLPLHRKTYPPILVCWFLCRFPQITYAKMQFFFSWWHPFQTKLICFSKQWYQWSAHLPPGAGSGKPALLHALFLKNEKQNSRKNYEATFSREVQGHMQKFNSFRGKKKRRPKKSLTLFMHAHLQFWTSVTRVQQIKYYC